MAIVIPYVKNTTWADGAGGETPISAAKLNVIEEGILDVSKAPAVRVYHNADQSIADSTAQALAFNSERFDQAGGASAAHHDTGTNNSRLTAVYAGIYLITANVMWESIGGAYTTIASIRLNGATYIADDTAGNDSTVNRQERHSVTTIYSLSASEYVECVVFHTAGSPKNVVSAGNRSPEFSMTRIA